MSVDFFATSNRNCDTGFLILPRYPSSASCVAVPSVILVKRYFEQIVFCHPQPFPDLLPSSLIMRYRAILCRRLQGRTTDRGGVRHRRGRYLARGC